MILLFAAAAVQAAVGEVTPPPVVAVPAVEASAPDAVAPTSAKLAALTPVRLKLDKDLISKTATIGEEFDLVLVSPIVLDNGYAVPAGTRGRGWVIHASKARMGGKPGELLLGARYLKLGDVEIPLRSMKLGSPQGKDNTGLSMGLMMTVGLAGAFVGGGQAHVEAGMDAFAKTAADVEIPLALLQKFVPSGPAIVAIPATPNAAPVAVQTAADPSNTNQAKGE